MAKAGVPRNDTEIAILLTERPDFWEYMLYAGTLLIGMERLAEKYGDYSIGYAPRLGTMIVRQDFIDFIQNQMGDLRMMINSLNRLFNEYTIEEAVGPPGVSGQPEKIVHAASRIIRLYEDMMAWAERIRGMAMRPEYRRVADSLVRFSSQTIEELRGFVYRFAAEVNEIPSLAEQSDTIVITEHLTFTIPDPLVREFNDALDALEKKGLI